jgi:hypothetical protein
MNSKHEQLLAALPTELLDKLATVASDAEKNRILDARIATLSEEGAEKVRAQSEAFLARHAPKYEGYDWKAALVGAQVTHTINIKGIVSFGVQLPSGTTVRAVQKWARSDEAKDLQPVTMQEATLLCWVRTVALADRGPSDITEKFPRLSDRLMNLRALSDDLISKVSNDCETLQTWVNTQLELDPGKS